MENEIDEKLAEELKKKKELEEKIKHQQDIERTIDILCQVEPVNFKGEEKYVPKFRPGQVYKGILKTLEADEIDLLTLNDDEVKRLGYNFETDKNDIIIKVSDKLNFIQRLKAAQSEKIQSIREEKVGLFDAFKIKHSETDLYDVLDVRDTDFLPVTKNNVFDEEKYQEIYKSNFEKFINLVKENDKSNEPDQKFFNSDNGQPINYTLEAFDKYMKDMFLYHNEIKDGDKNKYNIPSYANLGKEYFKNIIEENFKPKFMLSVDESIHANNHLDHIKNLSLNTKHTVAEDCVSKSNEVLNKLNGKDLSEDEKICAILNVREYYLTLNKLNKSFFFLTRWLNRDAKDFANKRDNLLTTLTQNIGVSRDYAKKFLDNKKVQVTIGKTTYDYNQIYNGSKTFESQMKKFETGFTGINKSHKDVDLNNNKDLAKSNNIFRENKIEKGQNLNK